ncbi:MAG: triose-phosphate isomerase [Candidatus Saccharibacteria bacterium]|nr:triose-phosphate isomerase [Candidatus Saccharibacteria bacterium]
MRKKIIVGNWKMHLNTSQASLLLHRLHERIKIHRDVEVVLAPNTLVLQPLSMQLDRRKFRLAAQNAHYKDEGAYTGEVSFTMLRDLVHYVIIGHSERRHIFGESLDTVRDKVAACVRNDISPIVCVGETKTERLDGETKQVIHDQVTTALSGLTSEDIKRTVIAYEPVWAISSGGDYKNHEVAKPDDVQKITGQIRDIVADLYGKKASETVRLLYGGSSNAENARSYLEVEGIDGLLPGGASLDYHAFSSMVATAFSMTHERE